MCSRGGYGAVHILQQLDSLPLRDNPKWLIGFSDITILHALLAKNGIESIHGSMTSHLAKTNGEDDDSRALFDILRGTLITYELPLMLVTVRGRHQDGSMEAILPCLTL